MEHPKNNPAGDEENIGSEKKKTQDIEKHLMKEEKNNDSDGKEEIHTNGHHDHEDEAIKDVSEEPMDKKNKYADEITILFNKAKEGDANAENQLFKVLKPYLKNIAANLMRNEREDHTMSSTDLMQEFYIKFKKTTNLHINDRNHFFRIVSKYMRQILVDYARRHDRESNNKGKKAKAYDEEAYKVKVEKENLDAESSNLLMLDKALRELEKHNASWVNIVEMRYFGGMTINEIADSLEIASRTVDRRWKYARTWLYANMVERPEA